MTDTSSKARVYAAADQIGAERTPTISTVRELAGVSNADATRYLREWREERLAGAGKIAAVPPSVTELAARLAGEVWAAAAATADARHAEVEKAWRDERENKDREIRELAADLDRLAAEAESAKETSQQRIDQLSADAEARAGEAAALTRDLDAAASENVGLATELAKARATVETLQALQEAILARINPEPPRDQPEPGGVAG